MLDPVTGLPAALMTGAVGAAVSALLSLFSSLLLQVPGFRAQDGSRNALMRALVFLLTLGGLVGLAASQGIALPSSMWPALVLYAAGGAGFAHLVYAGAKSSGSPSATDAPAPAPAVPAAPAPSATVTSTVPVQPAPAALAPAAAAPAVSAGGFPSDAAPAVNALTSNAAAAAPAA